MIPGFGRKPYYNLQPEVEEGEEGLGLGGVKAEVVSLHPDPEGNGIGCSCRSNRQRRSRVNVTNPTTDTGSGMRPSGDGTK